MEGASRRELFDQTAKVYFSDALSALSKAARMYVQGTREAYLGKIYDKGYIETIEKSVIDKDTKRTNQNVLDLSYSMVCRWSMSSLVNIGLGAGADVILNTTPLLTLAAASEPVLLYSANSIKKFHARRVERAKKELDIRKKM